MLRNGSGAVLGTGVTETAEEAAPVRTRSRVRLHPVLVAVPIGCWFASTVLDLAARSHDPREFTTAATWLVGIGLLGAAVAGFAGFVDGLPIRSGTAAYRRLLVHLSLAMALILAYLVEYVLRLGAPPDRAIPAGVLVYALANAAALVATVVWGALVAHRLGTALPDGGGEG
ncbi:putative membrane protein [Amycolatopsis echigonensis]|uniref:Membrane protein n=1 Tax=Amycolatopsis echigonensis TaxID=2576905 RepID=A0A2N3WLC6_9PSEU|nr:putative membrane protein [Amycolatopsis niigatensis]